MSEFTYQGKDFYLDGEKFVVRSGAIHYFRIPAFYWRDRLLKLKEAGFNCVETYAAWNLHERKENEFRFDGELDIGRFLDIAAELGLKAIVRPGPYICAEWEMGGFPSWLLSYRNIKLRTSDPLYVSKVERYFEKLLAILKPRLCTNGGNVIMLQVENEYGSYANDKAHLKQIVDIYRKNGMDCTLFTSDGPEKIFFRSSTLPELPAFMNFGSRAEKNLGLLEELKPDQPLMCAEFWCGWFDYWHEPHKTRTAQDICSNVEPFLKNGYSFNFYMFAGGTNFGFTNGANYFDETYKPIVTSYDYNALLTEAGDRTDAYYGVRELFQKYGVGVPELTATETQKRAYGEVEFYASAGLLENRFRIGTTKEYASPPYMEDCGQDFGYVLYSSRLEEGIEDSELIVDGLADRAVIIVGGEKKGVYERGRAYKYCHVQTQEETTIDVLVENTGRINFGTFLYDRKGATGVRLKNSWRWNRFICHWTVTNLPMEDLENLVYGDLKKQDIPTFYKGKFHVDTPADTFLKPSGFSKGFAVVNGFNLGRFYNEAGPQKTLFVPASVLKQGENEIVVFDSDGPSELKAEFLAKPEL